METAQYPQAAIVALAARDFRNFERLDLEIPEPGLAIVGENGQGKTNLLEAIFYFGLLRSARGARDVDVARFGAQGFFLDGQLRVPTPAEMSIGFERAGRRKKVRRDGGVIDRLSDALGTLPSVMFAPQDVELVTGAPSARRRFLDVMLALSSRGYLAALQQYRGALERRNAALRLAQRSGAHGTAIDVWDAPISQHGATLVRMRRAWVSRVADMYRERCAAIGETGNPALRYESSIDANAESVEEDILRALGERRVAEVKLGLTLVGPHRDDLALLLDGRPLRGFGSGGQQRTAAIALRTLEAETLRDAREIAPVFLLDDPFAELDARRATRVLRLLRDIGLGQTVLAVPRESDIPPELTMLRRATVRAGRVELT